MKPITREWLNAANDDLIVMEVMLGREEITNMVTFHARQAIEKSFKAIAYRLEKLASMEHWSNSHWT